jgi:hypothetical protein
MKSQSIAYLLNGSEHVYWILDLEIEVHTQYGLYGVQCLLGVFREPCDNLCQITMFVRHISNFKESTHFYATKNVMGVVAVTMPFPIALA